MTGAPRIPPSRPRRRAAFPKAGAALVALAAAGVAGAVSACAPRSASVAAPASAPDEPRWQDALTPRPEFLVVVRPRALRRDEVYGPLLRRVIQLARERSPLVTATRALDAIEDADEVLVGARDSGDLVLVIRGVRADLDPANLVDDAGRPLWKPGPSGPVRELVLARAGDDAARDPAASLFELPGRTWVIASGERRLHARTAFALPGGATAAPGPGAAPGPTDGAADLELDPAALAAARISGPSLVAHVEALRPPSLLAALGRKLDTVTLSLSPGADALVRATLTYQNDDAVEPAIAVARETLSALSESKPNEYAWLRSATVERRARRVVVATPLPRELVGAIVLPGQGPAHPH